MKQDFKTYSNMYVIIIVGTIYKHIYYYIKYI